MFSFGVVVILFENVVLRVFTGVTIKANYIGGGWLCCSPLCKCRRQVGGFRYADTHEAPSFGCVVILFEIVSPIVKWAAVFTGVPMKANFLLGGFGFVALLFESIGPPKTERSYLEHSCERTPRV